VEVEEVKGFNSEEEKKMKFKKARAQRKKLMKKIVKKYLK
jgi:hypothetical protein